MCYNEIVFRNYYDKEDLKKHIEQIDRRFESTLEDVAEKILNEKDLHIIRLCGPSCSGKTTAASMLVKALESNGKKAHIISIDDFFFDEKDLPRIDKGNGRLEIDYDSVSTIDLNELKKFVEGILSEQTRFVECPIYSFIERKRNGYKTYTADNNDIFIFEGIQAIYKEFLDILKGHCQLGIYISPQSVFLINGQKISPDELRFCRRLVRDNIYRNTAPHETFSMWSNVLNNEKVNIKPYIKNCDILIDSAMDYELGILYPYLKEILSAFPRDSVYYDKIHEIVNKLQGVVPISRSFISSGSLYNEFI